MGPQKETFLLSLQQGGALRPFSQTTVQEPQDEVQMWHRQEDKKKKEFQRPKWEV